ncbi:G-protein coupled receptor dmsr-1 [Leptopilina heterotoma]|uniref:G-protein coupled receptor dmsr-1 n=1 Tax=Leptopilina heterotoma TaxID=63436 RepID=UPI001CA7E8C1|nr:G-protein coupled receptor dmsr-1 [Leptopilina heterotoma]XP_043475243.1 G-protein coupled receptor dmsr-1 [Leptopilina heterotoma]XP_043475244.1 G-protein coupled receptor dmsr-1 [Leptopilina heterotoma]XP_043475245.1 G-protein coupled receptor dmsr-1 [Leptopilina heterotoma]XP_043475246.1 G-protein coupled receptor dmsr-1 [Leptopilina heterotoma]
MNQENNEFFHYKNETTTTATTTTTLSILHLKLLIKNISKMYRVKNYTEIFRKFNITDEDIDYINSMSYANETNDDDDETVTTQIDCYCSGAARDLAILYKAYHGYVALVVCVFGTVANILNIMVLTRKDMVVAPINRILTGLASADMLVMVEYIPFAIYVYLVLPENKIFPYGWAVFVLFHMHFSHVLHTISIALTLTLAVWRYIAIRFPQYNHCWCTAARCRLALWCSFLVPIIVCSPAYLIFGIRRQREQGTKEILYHVDANYSGGRNGFLYQLNFWIISVFVKLLPCVILTIISCWLIKALYRAKSRKQVLRGYSPCAATNGLSSRRASKSERRADRTTKMLVAVLLLFLVTEIPQGILGLLSGVLGDCFFRNCYHNFGEIMDILALINGAINFILYCSMSRQFRTTFGQLFKPRIIKKWHPTSQQTEVHSTFV